jgi:hypothetical protein
MKYFPMAVALAVVLSSCYDDSQDEYSEDPATSVCIGELPLAAVHFPLRTNGKQKLTLAADSNITCLKNMFGNQRVHHPNEYDTSYNTVLDFHHTQVPDIFGDGIEREKSFLVKLNHTNEFDFFLFRTETGLEKEGSFYDVLFTVSSKGELISHILAGAHEALYQREVIINGKNTFTIDEITGREENMGPTWKASFRISSAGVFTVEESKRVLAMQPQISTASHEFMLSNLVIKAKYKKDLEQGVKEALAGNGEVVYFEKVGKKDELVYLAVVKTEGGNLMISVINPPAGEATTDADGNYIHRANNLFISNPDEPGFTGTDFKNLTYGVSQGGNHIDISLHVTQHWQGDENSEVASGDTEKTYELEYDSETGIKVVSEE